MREHGDATRLMNGFQYLPDIRERGLHADAVRAVGRKQLMVELTENRGGVTTFHQGMDNVLLKDIG